MNLDSSILNQSLEKPLFEKNLIITYAIDWEENRFLVNFPWAQVLSYVAYTAPAYMTASITKIAELDIILCAKKYKIPTYKWLYSAHLHDMWRHLSIQNYANSMNLISENQNYFFFKIVHNQDIFIGNVWNEMDILADSIFKENTFIVYDAFFENSSSNYFFNTLESFTFFLSTYLWILVLLIMRLLPFTCIAIFLLLSMFLIMYSWAKENRFQFDFSLFFSFFFLFYLYTATLTFNTFHEEMLELLTSFFFLLFNVLILFLVYKYSIHYFAFLEATVEEGKDVKWVAKQFFRDFLNNFSLFLRFFVLLFRLNVYDTLDDFYDSYYIFLHDFDDDSYATDTFYNLQSSCSFFLMNFDDSNFLGENEPDILEDIYLLYFLVWSKLFFFIFFIFEEFFRLMLAFFICYLIIFDIHAVNSSYSEDKFFKNKLN